MASKTEQTVYGLALPIVEALGYELVDVEYSKQGKNNVLTIFADHKNGITLEDCEKISRALDDVLEEADPIAASYILCVSSPGLDRPLKKPSDFKRNLGRLIDVKLYVPFEGRKEYTGTLSAYDENTFKIECENETEIEFSHKEAALVRLHIDF